MEEPQLPMEPLLIGVMGATGTGKTTFINRASNTSLRVGEGLSSCTSDVAVSEPFQLDGRQVVLIDTPGFDDTNVSDIDILKKIVLYLNMSYEAGMTLSGLLYLHRISDIRMGGISTRNFQMFRKLCGDDTLKNVIIVTTMWGSVSPEVGTARETELVTDERFFKPAIDRGVTMARHDNTTPSAHAILHRIIQHHPLPLQIQTEMVEQGKDISQTAAAAELNKDLLALAEKHKKDIAELKAEMEEVIAAKDERARKELHDAKAELERRLSQNERDRQRLSKEYAAEKRRADEMMKKILKDMGEQRKANAEGAKRMTELQQQFLQSSQKAEEERQKLFVQMAQMRSSYDDPGIHITCVVQ